jgi:hypothetical protein
LVPGNSYKYEVSADGVDGIESNWAASAPVSDVGITDTPPRLNIARGKPVSSYSAYAGADATFTSGFRQLWKMVDGMDANFGVAGGTGLFWQGLTDPTNSDSTVEITSGRPIDILLDLLTEETFDTIAVISRINESSHSMGYGPKGFSVHVSNSLDTLGQGAAVYSTAAFPVNYNATEPKNNDKFYFSVGEQTARYIRIRVTTPSPSMGNTKKSNVHLREIKVYRVQPPEAEYGVTAAVENATLSAAVTFPAGASAGLTAIAAVYNAEKTLVRAKIYTNFADGTATAYEINEDLSDCLESGGRAAVFLWENWDGAAKPVAEAVKIDLP